MWELLGKEDALSASFFSAKRLDLFKPGVSKLLAILGNWFPEFPELISLSIILKKLLINLIDIV